MDHLVFLTFLTIKQNRAFCNALFPNCKCSVVDTEYVVLGESSVFANNCHMHCIEEHDQYCLMT